MCHGVHILFNFNISQQPAASILYPRHAGSRIFWNVGTYIPNYMASHPTRQLS